MRRSAAPSFQSSKRLKFLSPANSAIQINKENALFSLWNSESDNSINCQATETTQQREQLVTDHGTNANNTEHTAEELLELLLKPVYEESEVNSVDIQVESNSAQTITDVKLVKKGFLIEESPLQHEMVTSKVQKQTGQRDEKHMFCDSSDLSSSNKDEICYNVLWCKRSSKKHKIWEGDGVLIIKGRSAVLKDPDGKIIDRGIGYKIKEIESLEDGSKFFIGGKECEIQYLMTAEECKKLRLTAAPENNLSDKSSVSKQTNLKRRE